MCGWGGWPGTVKYGPICANVSLSASDYNEQWNCGTITYKWQMAMGNIKTVYDSAYMYLYIYA